MSVMIQCESLALTDVEVGMIWKETISYRQHEDDQLTVRCVGEQESAELNLRYRKKDSPTNVLTFSYDGEHDVALCLAVVAREAGQRAVPIEEYTALVLVHAFLHATGMDHERSPDEAEQTRTAEIAILRSAGFEPDSL